MGSNLNPILQAYIMGQKMREDAQERAFKETQTIESGKREQKRIDLEDKRIAQAIKQFESTEKTHAEEFRAQMEVNRATVEAARAGIRRTVKLAMSKGEERYSPDVIEPRGSEGEDVYQDIIKGKIGPSSQEILPGTEHFPAVRIRESELMTPEEIGQARAAIGEPPEEMKVNMAIRKALGLEPIKTREIGARGKVQETLENLRQTGRENIAGMNIQGRKDVAGMNIAGRRDVAGLRIDAAKDLETLKHGNRLERDDILNQYAINMLKEKTTAADQLITRRAELMKERDENKTVSVGQAKAFGVPSGTTIKQLREQNLLPRKELGAKQQEKYDMQTRLQFQIAELQKIGEETKWNEVGPFFKGNLQDWMATKFGSGSDMENRFRSTISQIRALKTHELYGSAFTETEKKMMDSFLASITQHPEVFRSRLQVMQDDNINELKLLTEGAAPTRTMVPGPQAVNPLTQNPVNLPPGTPPTITGQDGKVRKWVGQGKDPKTGKMSNIYK